MKKKNILLVLPPDWECEEIWLCYDTHVEEPVILDKDQCLLNFKLEDPGVMRLATEEEMRLRRLSFRKSSFRVWKGDQNES